MLWRAASKELRDIGHLTLLNSTMIYLVISLQMSLANMVKYRFFTWLIDRSRSSFCGYCSIQDEYIEKDLGLHGAGIENAGENLGRDGHDVATESILIGRVFQDRRFPRSPRSTDEVRKIFVFGQKEAARQ